MTFKVLNPFPTPSKFFALDQEITVEDLADAPRAPAFYVEQGYLRDLRVAAPAGEKPVKKGKPDPAPETEPAPALETEPAADAA